jgi:lysophospholipid acyltransferase (LPLAT)-like uncharacterized protein
MPPHHNPTIKVSRTSILLGYLAAAVMKLWSISLRYHINDKRGLSAPPLPNQPVIFTLWHNRIFTMPPVWKKTGGFQRSTLVLTSASRDGTSLATAMQIFGIGAIRGSSSRRAIAALIGMKNSLIAGHSIVVTPDGPKGPRYQVQPGLIKISQSTNTPIIPIHITYSSAWRLKSWDRFVIPKPFSRINVTFGQPIFIPKTDDEYLFESHRANLESLLINATDDA